MNDFTDGIPPDFVDPRQLPADPEQAQRWQAANRVWWERHPMRYDWKSSLNGEEFTREFFDEIDRRFLGATHEIMSVKAIPFDALVDFENLKSKDVLEIGVGNGSHAALLATHARSFTGIDLTEYAVRSTRARFQIFGLPGTVRQLDAEQMDFPNESFDFIWTWGVIHHSSNTRRILEQMHRVLRPGGTAIAMVYHRSFYTYWFCGGVMAGLLQGKLFKYGSVSRTVQARTDGALARYYTGSEWRRMVEDLFVCDRVLIYGNKPEILPIPGSRLKQILLKFIPNILARFFLSTLRQGSFLTVVMSKIETKQSRDLSKNVVPAHSA